MTDFATKNPMDVQQNHCVVRQKLLAIDITVIARSFSLNIAHSQYFVALMQ